MDSLNRALRTRRVIFNLAAAETFTAVTVLAGLVATPFLLRWLGDMRFGAFRVASDWYGYVGLLEFGLSGALLPLLAQAAGRKDKTQLRSFVIAGLKAYSRVLIAMLVAGLALTTVVTWLVPVGPTYAGDLTRGCLIGLLGLLVLPLSAFRALAEARQRGYEVSSLLIGQSLLITALALLLAWCGWGITGQFASVVLGGIVFHLALAWRGVRILPGILRSAIREPAQRSAMRQLWKLNWPTFAFDLCGRLSLLTDNILIARLLSPTAVVPFFATQRLALLAQRELQGVGNSSWAGLAEIHAQRQHELFNRRLIELTKLVSVFAVAGLVPIVAFNHHFVALWVGSQRYAGGLLTGAVAINAFLLPVFSLWGWCITGTGRIRDLMPAMVAQTAINLILSITFTLLLGTVGPVLGTTAAFLAVSAWYLPVLLHRTFGTSTRDLLLGLVSPLGLAIPYAIGGWWLARLFPTLNWFTLVCFMGAPTLLFLLFAWWLVLSPRERQVWVVRVNMLIRQRAAA